LATAVASSSWGKISFAQSGLGYATMFQLMSKPVIFSSAGRYAVELALLARATLAGSWEARSIGLSPRTASRAAPSSNAFAMP
jgi:hypothetical protein